MKNFLSTLLLVCTVAATTTPTSVANARLNLPQMGEPADQVMSPRDERRIGRGFMRQIRAQLNLVSDPEVNDYVQRLGKKLVSSQPGINPDDFTFFVINDPEINAFAIPGGFIGINSGLITAAANESQLASVMAHEAAHVMQRHIARLIAGQGNQKLKTAATVLAAILLAQQSAEAGQAALLTGLAASQQSAINFTRTHEYEADRLGIQLLSDANYNPKGMVEFFEVLRKRSALNGTLQLEFLRTHPLNVNRISEARNSAERLANPVGIQDSTDFQFQQMKLKVLHNNNPRAMLNALKKGHVSSNKAVRLYGQTLLHLELGNPGLATPMVDELLRIQPYNSSALIAGARVASGTQDYATTEELLRSIVDIQPDNYAANELLIDTLTYQGQAAKAERVITRYIRSTTRPAPEVFRKYARVLETRGQLTSAHEAMADHYFLLDETREAIGQLEQALKVADDNTNAATRVEARLDEVNRAIERAKQRK